MARTLRRLFLSLTLLAAATSPALAGSASIAPTDPLLNPDGTLAGFATTEPGVYFVIPSSWTLAPEAAGRAASLTAADADGFDLRLVLRPDYRRALPAVLAIRQANPRALFFPLPSSIDRARLFLPQAIGAVAAELSPGDGVDTPVAVYYRLRLSATQVDVLRTISHGGISLQGAVEISYSTVAGPAETAAPLLVQLPATVFDAVVPPPPPTAWLAHIFETTKFHVRGAVDGSQPLGGGISVSLKNSLMEAELIPSSWDLAVEGNGAFGLRAVITPDLRGTLRFDIPELNLAASVEFTAHFEAGLDLTVVQVGVRTFSVGSATVNGVTSTFHRSFIQKLFQKKAFLDRLSAALSSELQARILSETLFGLEEAL